MNARGIHKLLSHGIVTCVVIVVLVLAFYYVQYKTHFSNITDIRNIHGYTVDITRNKKDVAKHDTVQFTFTAKQKEAPAKLLDKTIYPHATIVSRDLRDIAFYHVDDLKILENDTYTFEHQFTSGGEYVVWVEFNNNTTIDHHGGLSDYIGRMSLSVSGESQGIAPVRLVSQSEGYRFQFIPEKMNVRSPSTFRIVVTREDGKRVKLIKNVDHFYFTANGKQDFYVLDHPDLPLVKDNEVVISNVAFPEHGQYAFWIRLFPDDGTGKITSRIEASFVLPEI